MRCTPLPLIALFIAWIVAWFATPATGQTFDPVAEVADVIYELVKVAPIREIAHCSPMRREMARDIYNSASKNNIPEILHTVNIYRESSFRKNALSENTEWYGLGQMHGVASADCDIKTQAGQLDCSAKWLRFCFERCLSWRGAITAYKTNGDCTTDNELLKRRVGGIIRTWKKYENQRQAIRDTIIDDLEYIAEMKEGDL